jgi:hypothetical protein
MKPGILPRALTVLVAAATLHGCGGESRDADEARDRSPEPTVFDPLTQAPGQVQQRLDASREGHEQALEDQISASEDAPAARQPEGE